MMCLKYMVHTKLLINILFPSFTTKYYQMLEMAFDLIIQETLQWNSKGSKGSNKRGAYRVALC